jgi:hypothetical protein
MSNRVKGFVVMSYLVYRVERPLKKKKKRRRERERESRKDSFWSEDWWIEIPCNTLTMVANS